ncbi:site-specific DNA-methyltransferase [Helicobacter pylori]|uniref:site-specific DNA-methyltransferase (adenine-specific) n=1 Tax=Helicobacter pylori TaxID=210 RepID=A0AAE7ARS7_HELPX|nr:site-specific DNA-methyltransferase [Helicobacter pylori]QJW29497.1 site-specific DNA-methyltransferase [Helicobacter pylori A45]QJW40786.1 site-specific DNA-methyltransferase [Helicobacter pylori]QJW42245.1 site-specific DNA-methyltransferase [Helicobacter pylori]QJW43702.1 site-specific DNA-methyltransferase [Helicobacter pylori]
MTDKNQAKKMGINIIQSQQENNPLFDMLLKNFPQTIKDGQVSLNAIKMLLGFNESINDISGYELTWTGKGLANALYSEPCQKQLKLQESFTPQNLASKHPNNAIIIGDNLDALKLLKSAYSEKIKMIYIDPPYNTGNDDFIYTDNFRQDYQKILREVGLMEIDENGEEIESEILKFFKNTQGSKTHSGWLSFMLPRLKLARDLLKEDGVIFISIDDNECAQLKLLCDEIFGEGNFVADFIRKTKSTTNDAKTGVNYQHEFLLCYAKDKNYTNLLGGEKNLKNYKNYDNDPNGAWISSDPSAKSGNMKTGYFAVTNPYTNKVDYPPNGKFWRFSQNTIQKHIDEGRICFKKEHKDNERGFIYKRYLKDLKTTQKTFDSLVFTDNLYMNQVATKELLSLELAEYFSYPKGVDFMTKIVEHATEKGDIILDFFAGSGTTAHAVMELNAEDEGNREFILVQIDEEIKEDENAYDFCKKELKSSKPVISDITIERVKRAAQKIIQSSKDGGLDLGFKVYTLEDKAQITNDKEEITLFNHSHLTPFDKALNLALQCGKTLNQPLEIIIKDKLYQCEDAYFCIVCDEEVREYLAKSKNEMIFLDGYEEIDLQAFLNLNAGFKERLSVVY